MGEAVLGGQAPTVSRTPAGSPHLPCGAWTWVLTSPIGQSSGTSGQPLLPQLGLAEDRWPCSAHPPSVRQLPRRPRGPWVGSLPSLRPLLAGAPAVLPHPLAAACLPRTPAQPSLGPSCHPGSARTGPRAALPPCRTWEKRGPGLATRPPPPRLHPALRPAPGADSLSSLAPACSAACRPPASSRRQPLPWTQPRRPDLPRASGRRGARLGQPSDCVPASAPWREAGL